MKSKNIVMMGHIQDLANGARPLHIMPPTLALKCRVANDQFNAHGYMFLNDVYDLLGFPRTQAGQVVGWIRNSETGDNHISFGPIVDQIIDKSIPAAESEQLYIHDDSILLDFNVDGVILDLLKD